MKYANFRNGFNGLKSCSSLTCAVGVALAVGLSGAVQAQTLPPPGGIINGIPVSTQFDDGYSYSTRILNYLQPTAGWDTSAGTGLLDLIITTRSSGQSNAGLGYSIPDPTTNPNTSPISDSWGTTATTGNMLVKNLYDYLFNTFGANTPVFTFDQNETGGNPDLLVNAKVEIINGVAGADGAAGAVLHTWAFDNTTQVGDGTFDAASYVTAPGQICIPDVMNNPADTVCFSNNVGSGKFDYIVYVPTMNLSLWADADNLFKISWNFGNVDDGGEEITMTGRFTGTTCVEDPTAPQCQTVPEPNSIALLGAALLALVGLRRNKKTLNS
jgi:hypothetical protein